MLTDQPRFSTPQATLMALPAYEPTAQSRMIFMPDFSARRFVAGGVMPTFDLLPDFFFRHDPTVRRAQTRHMRDQLDR